MPLRTGLDHLVGVFTVSRFSITKNGDAPHQTRWCQLAVLFPGPSNAPHQQNVDVSGAARWLVTELVTLSAGARLTSAIWSEPWFKAVLPRLLKSSPRGLNT